MGGKKDFLPYHCLHFDLSDNYNNEVNDNDVAC